MEKILKDFGWNDGFRIPIANEENKALELKMQKKQKEKDNLKSALDDINDRVSGMKKHLQNVQHQLSQSQNLIFAQNNQKTVEENLVRLAKIENNSLTNDIKRIKKEQGSIRDRQKIIEADINRITEHIQKLNSTINWDKDALLTWDEEVSRGDDDTFVLEKFKREDETKFKELELKRQSLGLEAQNKKNKLVNLKNDLISMEQSLDKTAQMFRRQHADRRLLVQQWEGSVRILHKRDEDINRLIEETGNLKSLAKERLKDLEEQKTFFENEDKNNKEIERDIETFNKQISDFKEKIKIAESIIFEENDKLSTLKTILSTTTTQYHNELNNHKNIMKEIQAKKVQIEQMKVKVKKAEEEFENSKNKSTSAAEKVQQLEEMLKGEEKIFEKNLLEFKKLDELMFQVMQQISELKEGEKNQAANIEHAEACNGTIKKHITKAKMELNRQKEILYNMDFAYMEKDILLNRMIGVLREQDSEKYEKRIAELEETHSQITATNSLLTKEVTRLDEDMRRLTIDLQGDAKEQYYLRSKRQENVMLMECGKKQLKTLRMQNQDKQVEENILKLKMKQAEKAIDKVGGKVFSLEKQRLELNEAMKEREVEIKTLRDILSVRRRVLQEQSNNLKSRINMARLKVEHLKNKYEVTILKLGKDDNGEPLSVTHIKIKGAQEKFELQELGDKLDSKIKRTEKEIQAMENTLQVVNATNKAFKNNLQSIDPEGPEQMLKKELELKHSRQVEEYREKKLLLENMEALTPILEQKFNEKLQTEENIMKIWKGKDSQIAEIDKDLKDQIEKLERADKQLKRLIKEVRGTNVPKFQTVEEKDIELRELMEQNEFGLQQLAELAAKTYDAEPVITRYLSEIGLSLPLIKSPSASIRCTSSSIFSPGRSSATSDLSVSSNSTCVITPSVVTLDSAKLDNESHHGNASTRESEIEKKSSLSLNQRKSGSSFKK